MPRRAAGQGALLEEDDVGPAEVGQVVGDAAPDDPAPDDDDAGAPWQVSHARPPTESRRASNPLLAKASRATSYLLTAHSQKSKSRSLAPDWMAPHRVQP